MSTHAVKIILITELLPHPNADQLEIIHIDGWQVVVRKGQFQVADLAIYIEPDYEVPTAHPSFEFLAVEGKDYYRLKAIKLRGEMSFGLLITIPVGFEIPKSFAIGHNVMDDLKIRRYVAPEPTTQSGALSEDQGPVGVAVFDVESLNVNTQILHPDEIVVVTEKVHGANTRIHMSSDGETLFIGSRKQWLKPEKLGPWGVALKSNPDIEKFMREHPGYTLRGEIFGNVQSLKYGRSVPEFVAFGLQQRDGRYIGHEYFHNMMDKYGIPIAPVLYIGRWGGFDRKLLEGNSPLAMQRDVKHMMEGCVILPTRERYDSRIGRVCLKLISNRYWSNK